MPTPFGRTRIRTPFDADYDQAILDIRSSPTYDSHAKEFHVTAKNGRVFPVSLHVGAECLAKGKHRISSGEEIAKYKADFDQRTAAIQAELDLRKKAAPQPLESLSASLEALLAQRSAAK